MKKSTGSRKVKTAVFISGTGSNLKNLIQFSLIKSSPILINFVLSNSSNAKGLNFARKNKIKYKVFNFKNKNKDENQILFYLKKKKINLICLAGFMKILSRNFIKKFKGKILNIHPSLLPKYRGSSPVSASILNGDTMTGISIMKLNSGIDSGPILSQKEVAIAKNETCEDLTTRLFSLSSKILIEVINKIEKGKITQKEQCEKEATYTKKLSRLDGLINWENSASEISNMIRAYHPWPGSYTVLNGRKLKIIESEFLISKHIKNIAPGEIFVDKEVFVGTSDGIIKLIKIQPEGKSAMNAKYMQ